MGEILWRVVRCGGCCKQLFASETAKTADVLNEAPTGKTVAFFYVTTNGGVNVRKSGDYVSKMIELAGGTCITFDDSDEENALSTMTIQMETFYEQAKDADYIIYNSTIDGRAYERIRAFAEERAICGF